MAPAFEQKMLKVSNRDQGIPLFQTQGSASCLLYVCSSQASFDFASRPEQRLEKVAVRSVESHRCEPLRNPCEQTWCLRTLQHHLSSQVRVEAGHELGPQTVEHMAPFERLSFAGPLDIYLLVRCVS